MNNREAMEKALEILMQQEIDELRAAYEALQKDLGLAKLALESKRDLLKSCESALEQSQADNAALQKENERLKEELRQYKTSHRSAMPRRFK